MRKIVNKLNGIERQKLKRKIYHFRNKYHKKILGKYNEKDFEYFLKYKLNINAGDHVMVHSSLEALVYWGLSPIKIIDILKLIVTYDGLLIFPTFVTRNSKQYVKVCNEFNVNTTPSQSGLLSEYFRRQKDVIRSLDPIKPVAVWGLLANEYVKDHHLSKYSYDNYSPLYKLCQNNGKVIGLGAPIQNLTLVHTIENIMSNDYPLKIYDDKEYEFSVIDRNRNKLKVIKKIPNNHYSRNMNIKKYCKYLSSNVVQLNLHNFTSYFTCEAKPFLEESINLAKKGITIYGTFK